MIRASLIAIAFAAAACTPPAETPAEPAAETPPVETATAMTREEATAQDICGAAQYRQLVGSNLAAVTLPTGSHRVIAPDTVVTMDFSAERLNIMVDAQGVITSVECF